MAAGSAGRFRIGIGHGCNTRLVSGSVRDLRTSALTPGRVRRSPDGDLQHTVSPGAEEIVGPDHLAERQGVREERGEIQPALQDAEQLGQPLAAGGAERRHDRPVEEGTVRRQQPQIVLSVVRTSAMPGGGSGRSIEVSSTFPGADFTHRVTRGMAASMAERWAAEQPASRRRARGGAGRGVIA